MDVILVIAAGSACTLHSQCTYACREFSVRSYLCCGDSVLGFPLAILARLPAPHQRLVRDVFSDYDRLLRPVRDPRKPVNVSVMLSLYQLLDVSEAVQSVGIYLWIREYWYDELIRWHPENYGGINQIVVKADKMWLPDTTLYNNLQPGDLGLIQNAIVQMNTSMMHKSLVTLQYPSIMKFSCNMFLLFFPFDVQNCSIELASWVHDVEKINYFLKIDHVELSNFIPSSEFEILSFNATRVEKRYSCCPNAYVSLYFHLVLQRKSLFYVVNLILPTCIITAIALIGFFFPSHSKGERKEKVSLGISTLLSMSVFLLMISDRLPTTSDFMPFIGD